MKKLRLKARGAALLAALTLAACAESPPQPTLQVPIGVPLEVQALADATPPQRSPDLSKHYFNALQQLIAQELRYPSDSMRRGEQGQAKVRVSFLRSGRIVELMLKQSSGSYALDSEAIAVFLRIGGFPPVPDSASPDISTFVLEMPINFALAAKPGSAPKS